MKTKNFPLIIGIAVPVVFIIIMMAIVYLPKLSINPEHNFIYTVNNAYNQYRNSYRVENGSIVIYANPISTYSSYKGDYPELYIYDIEKNTSKMISQSEASKLGLEPGPSSPDGYNVGYSRGSYGLIDIFGGGQSDSGFYIEKDGARKKLSGLGIGQSSYYYSNIEVIGWIK